MVQSSPSGEVKFRHAALRYAQDKLWPASRFIPELLKKGPGFLPAQE
jgi:hypothetical protein